MDELGRCLLQHARQAIAQGLGQAAPDAVDLPELHKNGATFVTLTQDGHLRGCIGSLEAWRALIDDVRGNAVSAAFKDPRFSPLNLYEFPRTRVEVSLLTSPESLRFTDEKDALGQLQPGIDGVIFSAAGRRSTFLPQVWEQLPEPAAFLAHLKQKTGLPADYWGKDVMLARYHVRKWQETPC